MPDAAGTFKGISLSGKAAETWERVFGKGTFAPLREDDDIVDLRARYERLVAARGRRDLAACLALRREDIERHGLSAETLEKALDEERRWHARCRDCGGEVGPNTPEPICPRCASEGYA